MAIRATRLAKLTRPALATAYARTRLYALLDEFPGTPAIWIAGPPGSGKTTLVAGYTAQRSLDCLWYQLDRGDVDPAALFFYLTEAVRERRADVALPPFQPEYLGDLEVFGRTFFRQVYRQTPAFLVFDNYQDGPGTGTQDLVLAAMEELPAEGRIFVISRQDPPAKFAGLRARGRLAVVGWNDLRLLPEECRGIAEARNLHLSESEVEQLHARTQGWAAGLVLLLQGLRTKAVTVSGVAGAATPTVIFDYVAEEIFEKLEPPIREFLLQVANLPQVTVAMAEQLGLAGDARKTLRELARSEFLLTTIQPEPQLMVQLHPLLREFLLARAEQTGTAEEIGARQLASARVLAEHGHIEEAAALFIRLRRWDELSAQIRALADALLAQGRGQTLEGWIRALPAARWGEDPWLQFWLGAARLPYAIREARELFVAAYEKFSAGGPGDLRGTFAALNGAIESILYDCSEYQLLDPWIEAGARLGSRLTECGSAGLEARLVSNIFMAMALRQPQHADIALWRDRAQQLLHRQSEPNILVSVYALLTALCAWVGQLARGEPLVELMRAQAGLPEVSPVSATKSAQAESMYYMLTGDGQRCIAAAERGQDIVARSGVRLWNDTFHINALYGALANADLEAAAHYLERIEARPTAERRMDQFLHAYGAAWYAALRGDAFLAHQQLKLAMRAATALGLPFFQVIAGMSLSQILFDSGDARGAQVEYTRALETAARIRNRLLEFMTLMVRARISFREGNEAEGLGFLRTALAIGRERGFMHYLWWHPQHAAQLCQRALQADIETDYVRRLIVRRNLVPDPPPYSLASWPWRFRLQLLGRFAFSTGAAGDPAAASGARVSGRPLALLQALVALGSEHVKLERLGDALWPHVDSDYALRSLNTTLHRLRKLLGDDSALLLHSGELSLSRRHFWLDCWAFEQSADAALALCAGGQGAQQPEELLRQTRQALAHYRGPLLAERTDDAWTIAPRERYRVRLQRLLSTVCETLEPTLGVDSTVDLCRQALECEPLSEPICRRLMLILNNAGRGAEAIEVYQRCRALIRAELKAEPSAATQELYQSMRPRENGGGAA